MKKLVAMITIEIEMKMIILHYDKGKVREIYKNHHLQVCVVHTGRKTPHNNYTTQIVSRTL
jgi:hypothetical protein